MRQLILIAVLIALCVVVSAQTPLPPGTVVEHSYPALDTPNQFSGLNQFLYGAQFGPTLYANLPTEVDGTIIYCSDCQLTQPCSAGGLGAYAYGAAGVWTCNQSGAIPTVTFQTNGTPNPTQSFLNLLNNTTGAAGIGFTNPSAGNVQGFIYNLTNQSGSFVQTSNRQGATTSGLIPQYTSSGDITPSTTNISAVATVPLASVNIAPGTNGQCLTTQSNSTVWGGCNGLVSEQLLSNQYAIVPVSGNTTSPQQLYTYTITNSLNTLGKILRITFEGDTAMCGGCGSETIASQLSFGGASNSIVQTTVGSFHAGIAFTWRSTLLCTVTATGTSGTISCEGQSLANDSTSGGTGFNTYIHLPGSGYTYTVNLTGSVVVANSVSYSIANTSNAGNGVHFVVELLN